MKVLEVTEKYVFFNPGDELLLTKRQADARAQYIKALSDDKEWPRSFLVVERTGFKRGEVVSVLSELHKAWPKHFNLLEDDSPEEELEAAPELGEEGELDEVANSLEADNSEEGEGIELPSEDEVEPGEQAEISQAEKLQMLFDASAKVEKNDENYTDDGVPTVRALSQFVDFDFSAKDRDAAMKLGASDDEEGEE